MGGLGGGHYTAYAKNILNEKWYLFDDSSVHEVRDLSRMISSNAYVLFYKLRAKK
jgi:ubiquitin carboxyl-terminal hydrolase 4/11/15